MLLESEAVWISHMEARAMSSKPLLTDRVTGGGWLMLTALAAGLVIVTRGTYDLSRLDSLLPLPLWLFFFFSVGLIVANVRSAFQGLESQKQIIPFLRAALVLAIPAGFLGAALDCMGLSLSGCTPVCTFLVRGWFHLIVIAAAAYLVTGRTWLLLSITLMSFVYLIPNCACFNPMNAWWLQHLHKSPACFGAGYWVSLIAVAALLWKRFTLASAITCWMINVVLLAFFVGHHFYHIPW